MKYFAYGSNMNHEQMKERCLSSKFLKPVHCKKKELVFVGNSPIRWKGPIANIKEGNGEVYGGLFEVNEDNLAALDCCEGSKYEHTEVEVFDQNGIKTIAITYIRRAKNELENEPSEKYLKTILKGAIDCHLPEEYRNQLKLIKTK